MIVRGRLEDASEKDEATGSISWLHKTGVYFPQWSGIELACKSWEAFASFVVLVLDSLVICSNRHDFCSFCFCDCDQLMAVYSSVAMCLQADDV